MKFKDKIKAAGFKDKKQFAEHMKMEKHAVYNWGETPETRADIILDLNILVIHLRKCILELLKVK